MSMSWTKEQEKVIYSRNRNLLVSAAAGSGKTAVLVERIIQMLTDQKNPVDISNLLIVTFTNAAAAEMKERIGLAIEKCLLSEPDNLHLQKQLVHISRAKITTIHSFCLSVIQDYFNTIDLDPSFRIGQENELTLLKGDVLEKLLEAYYTENSDDFIHLIECYSRGKKDNGIEDLVMEVYHYSRSYPQPDKWLNDCIRWLNADSMEAFEQTPLMTFCLEHIRITVKELLRTNEMALEICRDSDGPVFYQEALLSDRELLENLSGLGTFEAFYQQLSVLKWTALSRKKMPDAAAEKKDLVKSLRDSVKDAVNDLKSSFFFQTAGQMTEDMNQTVRALKMLVQLVKAFAMAYQDAKKDKNLLDFNDLEHYALKILTTEEAGEMRPSQIACEISHTFEEILCDEYQDSNLVQETILTSISKEKEGTPNIFMVGDVKQSIYKFRLARPELFMEKYDAYSLEDSLYQRIDLHKNFRSRPIVLEAINHIFYRIMGKGLGGIEYDEDAALYAGATFSESKENISDNAEIILVDTPKDVLRDLKKKKMTERELEALAVAGKIREMTDEQQGLKVLDKHSGEYRECRLGDIVILLRTMSGWSDTFVDILTQEGILAHADTTAGFFETTEIKTVLSYLRVLDNPRQDIPFTAVLLSPIGQMTNEEVSMIRSLNREKTMDISCRQFLNPDSDPFLEQFYALEDCNRVRAKLKRVMDQIDELRNFVPILPIHELLQMIYQKTGYYYYIAAMPTGERRQANLDMLVEKAIDFGSTSYKGLFNFIRYIEQLKKYEIDFGEAITSGEGDQSVRIMSIHKSKGLEYPVVIVAGMGKNFNQQDARASLILHSDFGFGPDMIDVEKRIKTPTLAKKILAKKTVMENLGEELRVLYVALTRAKEKLIMTGAVKDMEKSLSLWQQAKPKGPQTLVQLIHAKNFLDWILPVTMDDRQLFKIERVGIEQLLFEEIEKEVGQQISYEQLNEWDGGQVFDENIRQLIEDRLSWSYEFENETQLFAKMTVSELKRQGQNHDEEWSAPAEFVESSEAGLLLAEVLLQQDAQEDVKQVQESKTVVQEVDITEKGIQETVISDVDISKTDQVEIQEKITRAARRGTAYHKVVEKLDFASVKQLAEVKDYLEMMLQGGQLTQETYEMINPWQIYQLLRSELAARMNRALNAGRLYRERQFVLGMPASAIDEELVSDEQILIQGIIDAYFIEDGKIVLIDFKTDYVEAGKEKKLIDRYRVQLDYYAMALEQLTHLPVKEKFIYSFVLNKAIPVIT